MNLGKRIIATTLLSSLFVICTTGLRAATVYWDPTGTLSSNGGGSGTWNTNSTSAWWLTGGAADSAWTDVTGTDTAVFGGPAGSYAVTVSGNNVANGLTFNSAGYTLSGGTVTLAGTTPAITANASATINSRIVLSGSQTWTTAAGQTLNIGGPLTNASYRLTLAGSGTTVFTAANVLLGGGMTANGGTLAFTSTAAQNTYANRPLTINTGAVVQSYGQLNLNVNQNGGSATSNIIGTGTLVLAATGASRAVPDIYFGPDQSGNSYYGARITVTTLDLGAAQRFIDGTSGHNAVAEYYGNSDGVINSNIIGSGGITYYATSAYSNQYGELVLGGSNSFTGPVEVDRGAIFLTNASALTQANAVTLSNNDGTYSNLFLLGYNATITNLQSAGSTPAYTGLANGNPHMNGPSNVTNPAALTINQTANTTFAGRIADAITDNYDGSTYVPGPLSIVKTGTGTLTLTNSLNSFTGGTTVNAGMLAFANQALTTAGTVTLNGASGLQWYGNNTQDISSNGMTLQFGASANVTLDTNGNNVMLSGPISGGNTLTKVGPGSLTLNGPVSYGGGTTVAAGSILFGPSSLPATGLIKLTGGALQIDGPYTTVAGWMASGKLDHASTGALALTANSDSTENINMATYGFPTLSLGAASGATIIYTGTLTPYNPSVYYLGGGGGQITFSNLRLTGAVSAVLRTGDPGGSGTVAFPDSADTTQTNTYTGATTINGGLVIAPVLANGGHPSTIGQSSNSASNLILNGGGIQYTGTGASTDRNFNLGILGGVIDASGTGPLMWTSSAAIGFVGSGPRTLTLQGSDAVDTSTLALTIADSGGPTSLVTKGSTTWLPSSANTYTGPTILAGGTLVVPSLANGGQPSTIGASTNNSANLVFNGGALQYMGTSTTIDRSFTLGASGGTIAVATPGQTLTLTGSVTSIGANSLTLPGPGNLALPINNGINNLGAINVNGGNLAVGGGTFNSGTQVNVASGATFTTMGSIYIPSPASGDTAFITGAGTLQLRATGTSLASPDLFAPYNSPDDYGVIINTPVDVGPAGVTRYLETNSNNDAPIHGYNGELQFAGGISGGANLYFWGIPRSYQASFVLPVDNPGFTGNVTIERGDLYLESAAALSSSNSVLLNPAAGEVADLRLWNTSATIGALSSTGSGSSSVLAHGLVSLTVSQTGSSTYGGLLSQDSGGALSLVNAGGTLLLTNTASNFIGSTTVLGGVLAVSSIANGGVNSPIGAATNDPANLVLAGGTLQYTGIGNNADRSFTLDSAGGAIAANGTGPINWTNSGPIGYSGTDPRSLTLGGSNTGANTMGLMLADAGDGFTTSVVKTGPGTWVLSVLNTYTGPTTIQQGLLQLNGGSSLQSPLVLSGGTLLVNNAFAAGPTVSTSFGSGFTVSSPSTLNLQAGTTWNTTTPLLSGSGALTVNSPATINVASFAALGLGNYPLIELNGGSFGGTSGTAGLMLGSLPPRVQAHLITSTLGGVPVLDLDITAYDTIKWTGAHSTAWDTTTQNWKTVIGGQATTYIAQPKGDLVTFDDSASGGTIDIASTVQPTSVTVNNNSLNYLFSSSTGTGGISGSTLFVKSGSGNATLATNNSYSGGTFINGGTLTLGNGVTPAAGSIAGDVALDNTATGSAVLQFNRPDTALFAGNVSGNGSLVQAGSGLTIVTGSNTYNGLTTVSGGSLQIGNGGSSGLIPGDIVNNGAVIYSRSDSVTLVNAINGPGTTYVNAGTLQVGNGSFTGSIDGPIVTNATLAFNRADDQTFSGVISGSGGVTQLGSNNVTFAAPNTYAGPTAVNGGMLTVASVANGGLPSNLGASSNNAANLTINGATFQYTGTTATSDRGLTLGAAGATFIVADPAQTLTLTGSVAGPGALTNAGPGTLMLTGSGVITGAITANANTVVPGISAPGSNSSVSIASGAVLGVTGQLRLNGMSSGYTAPVAGGGTLALLSPNSSIANPDIYANVVSNANWGVFINTPINLGSGARFIGGTAGNNNYGEYDGLPLGAGGDLALDGPLFGAASVTVQGTPYNSQFEVVLAADNSGWTGPLKIVQGAVSAVVPNALNGNDVTLAPSGGTAAAALYLFGQDITIGSLSGTASGALIRNGSLISGGNGSQPRTNAILTVNQATDGTFAGVMSDGPNDYYGGSSPNYNLGLVKSGSATLTLSGTNIYTGGTTVSDGTLIIASASSIPSGGDVTVGNPLAFPSPVVPSQLAGGSVGSSAGITPVPEPGTLVLAVGLCGAAICCRFLRRRKSV